MNRKALIVGIDFYEKVSNLHGCVNDSKAVKKVLVKLLINKNSPIPAYLQFL